MHVTCYKALPFFRRMEDEKLATLPQFNKYDNEIRRLKHELLKATSHKDTER